MIIIRIRSIRSSRWGFLAELVDRLIAKHSYRLFWGVFSLAPCVIACPVTEMFLTDPARRCDRRPSRSFRKWDIAGTALPSDVGITAPVPTQNWERLAVMPVAAARCGRDPLLAKTRDAIGMQLRIIDRPAFLLHTIGTEAAVRVHDRLITLAVAHVLLRRPRA